MEDGFSGTWCNSLFRMAVTAAKKVKTETKLSGISVSTATLAVKAAEMYFGSLENRKILVIGATGKIGQIMMKNIAADHHVQLYAASRQLKSGEKAVLGTDTLSDGHGTRHQQTEEYVQIAYADRYRLANELDVIISATASPPYPLTKEGWQSGVIQKRRRILIDMAVPMDIEAGRLEWQKENLTEKHLSELDEAFLVICASNDETVNVMAADYCQKRHILVDCAKPGENSDCVFPSVVRRGNVVVGISTSGGVPALTKHLREKIEAVIPEWYGDFEGTLRDKRRQLKQSDLSQAERRQSLRQWIAKEEKIREEGKGQYENRNEEEPSGHGADGNGGGGH